MRINIHKMQIMDALTDIDASRCIPEYAVHLQHADHLGGGAMRDAMVRTHT